LLLVFVKYRGAGKNNGPNSPPARAGPPPAPPGGAGADADADADADAVGGAGGLPAALKVLAARWPRRPSRGMLSG
jgi:hypothetical protein